ncbi:MAG: GNAT family N-acetyltransferase [Spirochaetia bacterium]|nr:GNAT family N-acetyltransferase [Spirochaetia bacterium]
MFTYRKATIDDISILTELRIEFLKEVKGADLENKNDMYYNIEKYLNNHITDESFIAWLCVFENEVIATSGISFYEVPPSHSNITGKIGYIMNMYTKKPYRRKGIASILFEKIIEEGLERKVGKLSLHASKDGKSLYQKYGFIENNDEMVFYKFRRDK